MSRRAVPWPRDPLAWIFQAGPKRGQPKILVEHGCWIWQGHKDKDGYGHVSFPQLAFPNMRMCREHGIREGWRKARAHQLTFFLKYGNAPAGLELGHTCMRRACCHPDHLTPVTLQTNYSMKFYPPDLPEELRREIERRIVRDEPYQQIADDYHLSIWNVRTMANDIDWRAAMWELMAECDDTGLADSGPVDGAPF